MAATVACLECGGDGFTDPRDENGDRVARPCETCSKTEATGARATMNESGGVSSDASDRGHPTSVGTEREDAGVATRTPSFLQQASARQWEIVFDLDGRDEDSLVEAVERLLCDTDDHPDGSEPCRVRWFSCTPYREDDEPCLTLTTAPTAPSAPTTTGGPIPSPTRTTTPATSPSTCLVSTPGTTLSTDRTSGSSAASPEGATASPSSESAAVPLLSGLLADPERLADLAPARPGAAEVPNGAGTQVVRHHGHVVEGVENERGIATALPGEQEVPGDRLGVDLTESHASRLVDGGRNRQGKLTPPAKPAKDQTDGSGGDQS